MSNGNRFSLAQVQLLRQRGELRRSRPGPTHRTGARHEEQVRRGASGHPSRLAAVRGSGQAVVSTSDPTRRANAVGERSCVLGRSPRCVRRSASYPGPRQGHGHSPPAGILGLKQWPRSPGRPSRRRSPGPRTSGPAGGRTGERPPRRYPATGRGRPAWVRQKRRQASVPDVHDIKLADDRRRGIRRQY
jgi:hypothetical protein